MSLMHAGYPGEVDEAEFSKMMRFASWEAVEGLALAPSGSSRGVQVTFTRAFAPGILVEQSGPIIVNADANGTGNPRIDLVILRHDWATDATTLTVKHGTPAATPSPPSVVRNPGVLWEQPLGQLLTNPGQGAYPGGQITAYQWRTQSGLRVLPTGIPLPPVSERQVVIDEATRQLRFSDGSAYRDLQVPGSALVNQKGWVPIKNGSHSGSSSFAITGIGQEFPLLRLHLRTNLASTAEVALRVNGLSASDYEWRIDRFNNGGHTPTSATGANAARWAYLSSITGAYAVLEFSSISTGSTKSWTGWGGTSAAGTFQSFGRFMQTVTMSSLTILTIGGVAFNSASWWLEGYRP